MTRREVVVSLLQKEACSITMQQKVLKTYMTLDRPDSLRTSLEAMPLKQALRLGLVTPVLTTPYEKMEEYELKETISRLFLSLTKREREVVELIFNHSFTFSEAAKKLGITKPAVGQAKKRALLKFRQRGYLKDYEFYIH